MEFQAFLDEERLDFESQLLRRVFRLLSGKNLSIACAESITGGNIARLLMACPGSSQVFRGGVVAYATDLKIKYCGVSPKTIKSNGVVSEAVAKEMAEGIRKQMNADYAISSTGYASAALDNAVEYPVGSCYIGLASAESVIAKHYQFEGDRDTIIHHASTAALSLLKDQLRFKV